MMNAPRDSAAARLRQATTRPPMARSGAHAAVGSEREAFGRLAGLAAGLLLLLGLTYVVPPLRPLRPWVPGGDYVPFWNIVGRELLGEGKVLEAEATKLAKLEKLTTGPTEPAPRPAAAPAPQGAVFPPYAPASPLEPPERKIEQPEALDGYYRKLTLVDLGVPGAIARAGHWGDSVLGVDGITSWIRGRLQGRFGDAGHGFHMMDRYHASYRQQGVEFQPVNGWLRCLIVFECNKRDHRYGYGGLLATSSGGSEGMWATPDQGFGRNVSRFEVWFARQERGGNLEIRIDDDQRVIVATEGPHLQDAWHEVRVNPGPHRFGVRAAGGGHVRAYGVVLENDGPGVVWDGMALISGSTRSLRTHDPEHIASQIRHRDLDLVAFMFGGNDMERNYVDLKESMQPYYDEYAEVLKKYRAAKPGLSCLVLSVLDHGYRKPGGGVGSRAFAKKLSRAQKEIARLNGCAFFDTFEATGGTGTAARWIRSGLMAGDLGHPTSWGHKVIGGLVSNALLYGYEQYRARRVGQPLPELDAASAVPVRVR